MGKRIIFMITLFVGVGACGGSAIAFLSVQPLLDGESYLGLTTAMLQQTPFRTFLVPGIFLALVLGLGNLLTALLIIREDAFYLSMVMGGCLIAWILIQVALLQKINILHLIFLLIGFWQLLLSKHLIRACHQQVPFSAHQN